MWKFLSIIVFFLTSCGQDANLSKLNLLNNPKGFEMLMPVEKYGALSVKGKYLINNNGDPVQLRGMSSHGIAWYPQLYNVDSLKWLRDDWNSDLFRIAMYTEGGGGYMSNKAGNKAKVYEMIDAAIALGVYVLVDWHILSDGNPYTHMGDAKAFFAEVSGKYKDTPNIIYEICNEPNGGGVNWGTIKGYANEVIPVIRSNAPKSVIVVGTSVWSSQVQEPANDPLRIENIAYSLHFYAGSHGQNSRNNVSYAVSKGIALFATEWGTSQASGDGGNNFSESDKWLKLLADNKISWANWSLTTKQESSGALKSWASGKGGWSENDLSNSGKYIRNYLRSN